MTAKRTLVPRYKEGDVCVFTNRDMSGVTSNNGKYCQIVRVAPVEEWIQDEPLYAIHFLDEDRGFGVRECELSPTHEKAQ